MVDERRLDRPRQNGVVLPQASGYATLIATSPHGTAKVAVHVARMDQVPSWEFRRHVLPILARAGCNMGACHGALAGKGGFKLSLRGDHPEGDFQAIARDAARGRRIELSDPGRSLLLAKPTTAAPTRRFAFGSRVARSSRPRNGSHPAAPPAGRMPSLRWSGFKLHRPRCGSPLVNNSSCSSRHSMRTGDERM